MRPKFDADAAKRIGDAVREIEAKTSAELVVDIRARSGSYAHADARFAATLTLVSLVALVFMPWTVPPIAVPFDAVIVYLGAIVVSRRIEIVRRLFTRQRERLQAVRTHAAALFHDRGIANTADETGVLLYASLLERRVEVLADRGVLQRVAPNEWNALLDELHVDRPLDPYAVIAAIRTLGAILERDVPAAAENVDELPSAPEIQLT